MLQNTILLPDVWQDLPLSSVATLAPIQKLDWPIATAQAVEIFVKREDLLHPALGGNKFYKLFHHVKKFRRSGKTYMASFGGAYSNHLYALAALGKACEIPTLGFVRGYEPKQLSPTLQDAIHSGMKVSFLPGPDYRRLSALPTSERDWFAQFPAAYFIPEGGGDLTGAHGCADWAYSGVTQCEQQFGIQLTHLALAAGTGGTLSGVLSVAGKRIVHGFLALKGDGPQQASFKNKVLTQAKTLFQKSELNLPFNPRLILESSYHCGGYAKFPSYLQAFVEVFTSECGVPLDRVYTAKLFWGLKHAIETGQIACGSSVLVFHTGGLQGNRPLLDANSGHQSIA